MAKRKKSISHAKLVASGKAPASSRAKHPCQVAWEVFSATLAKLGTKFTRKLAIDAALKAGVAFYTARTQYQQWKEAGDNDRKTQAKWNTLLSSTPSAGTSSPLKTSTLPTKKLPMPKLASSVISTTGTR